MDKKQYQSLDSRTGYAEGGLVELTDDELNNTPFNVFMRAVSPVDDKELIGKALEMSEKNLLKNKLLSLGLSPNRVEKVIQKFPSESLLRDNSSDVGIDDLTDKFIKENFQSEQKRKPSKK